ncbi:MAG: nitroreductase, partial [Thermoplasmata archaeon]
MEEEVMKCIKERRSIRDYTDEPLSRELIEEIIMAGRYAPSAENSQPWKFIVITSRDEIASLSGEVKRQI